MTMSRFQDSTDLLPRVSVAQLPSSPDPWQAVDDRLLRLQRVARGAVNLNVSVGQALHAKDSSAAARDHSPLPWST